VFSAVGVQVKKVFEAIGIAAAGENRLITSWADSLFAVQLRDIFCAFTASTTDPQRGGEQGGPKLAAGVVVFESTYGTGSSLVVQEGGLKNDEIFEVEAISDADDLIWAGV
jgi:hypothetical protein